MSTIYEATYRCRQCYRVVSIPAKLEWLDDQMHVDTLTPEHLLHKTITHDCGGESEGIRTVWGFCDLIGYELEPHND